MLELKLKDRCKFDLPPTSIHIVEEDPEDGCVIAYDLGQGMMTEQLSDQFGYVRKKLSEQPSMVQWAEFHICYMTEDDAPKAATKRLYACSICRRSS